MTAVSTLAFAVAVLGWNADSVACPAFPTDPATLVGDAAVAVAGVDVDAFAKTTTGAALLPALRADLGLAEALEIFDDCKIELDRTYALTLARDRNDGRMVVIQARGVGSTTTLACLADELRARSDGVDPWQRITAGQDRARCHDTLELVDGSRVFVINDYTLVWARGSLADTAAARLDGRETAQLPSPLQAAFARLDRSGHLWLAANLDDEDRRALPWAWATSVTTLTAAVDLSEGLRAVVSLAAPDVAATASLRDLVLAGFADLADRLDDYGVEHRLREQARVGIVDGVVAAELSLDEGELRSIRTHVGERIRGKGPL